MNIYKEARRDAREYARAKMYYGDGAGVRRRLINETVQAKGAKNPAYATVFHKELAKQDMAEHASKARRERERRDIRRTFSRNSRGLATGNYASVNTGVLLIAVGLYFAHKNGLDVKAYEYGKKKVQEFRDNQAARHKVVPTIPHPTATATATVHPHPTAYRAN